MIPRYSELLASTERLMLIDEYEMEIKSDSIDEAFDHMDIKSLSFAYDKDMIIKDLNLVIKDKDFIHILGPSGKGKSTLFKLILNLLETHDGTITITTKQNTYNISNQTRSLISYVPQNLLILSGTIRDNLNLFKVYTDQQLYTALEIAELKDFVKALPQNLDTMLKEKGAGLSIGQIQRLAIARALLKDAPILLLDEITSALDQDRETKILKNIKALTNKTVIISSHRPIDSDIITKTITL
jgi:ATP-binding cassette subfamily B protein